MDMQRQDRDLRACADEGTRVFTCTQLDAELARVEARFTARQPKDSGSCLASSPGVEKRELSPRSAAELAPVEEQQRQEAKKARRGGSE